MLDDMKEEILSELRCAVATLQSSLLSCCENPGGGRWFKQHGRQGCHTGALLCGPEGREWKTCVDDQENRSQRQNIRVVSLPEKSEGSHPTNFMETFLVEVFGGDSFPVKPAENSFRSLVWNTRSHILQCSGSHLTGPNKSSSHRTEVQGRQAE